MKFELDPVTGEELVDPREAVQCLIGVTQVMLSGPQFCRMLIGLATKILAFHQVGAQNSGLAKTDVLKLLPKGYWLKLDIYQAAGLLQISQESLKRIAAREGIRFRARRRGRKPKK